MGIWRRQRSDGCVNLLTVGGLRLRLHLSRPAPKLLHTQEIGEWRQGVQLVREMQLREVGLGLDSKFCRPVDTTRASKAHYGEKICG